MNACPKCAADFWELDPGGRLCRVCGLYQYRQADGSWRGPLAAAPEEPRPETKLDAILRLHALGRSDRQIAVEVGTSTQYVAQCILVHQFRQPRLL